MKDSGSGLKDSSINFEDDDSKQALNGRLPQEAIDTLFERLAGRVRPAAVAIEKIIEGDEQGAWKFVIEDAED
ncbi:hypothetical protein CPC16_002671, partial [Podila verticillata]